MVKLSEIRALIDAYIKTNGNQQSDNDKTDDTNEIDKDKEVENGDVSNGDILKDKTTWGEIY